MEKIDQDPPDRIYEVFQNKTIFLTGGTGFMGKVFIERLLRLMDVKKIYILIRTKKEQSPENRLEQLFTSPLFDKVRQEKGEEILRKCHVIPGDVTLENLGLSPGDSLILRKEVEFVFHSAATVRFDEPLKTAVAINVKGVQQVIALAKEMEKLQIFIHVSTAYCHPEEKVLYEKFYKTSMKPDNVIQMVDWLNDEQVNNMAEAFLDGIPNNYTFTKSLGEAIIADEIDNLPVIVVRPSIIVPIWKEPLPGWTDNINGPTGLLIAAGKGVSRTMYGNENAKADFISVDAGVDGTLGIVAYSVINGRNSKIFNLCSSSEIQITWGEVLEMGREIVSTRLAFDVMLWRPGGSIKSSKILHLLALLFYQLIPALIVDALAFCFGYKPFLWKIQKRILNGMQIFEYYVNNEWTFNIDNSIQARQWMNTKEMERYVVDGKGLNMLEYFENCMLAARKYILKEPEENLPRAKRRMQFMIWLDRICNVLIKFLLAYLFYNYIFLYFYK